MSGTHVHNGDGSSPSVEGEGKLESTLPLNGTGCLISCSLYADRVRPEILRTVEDGEEKKEEKGSQDEEERGKGWKQGVEKEVKNGDRREERKKGWKEG